MITQLKWYFSLAQFFRLNLDKIQLSKLQLFIY